MQLPVCHNLPGLHCSQTRTLKGNKNKNKNNATKIKCLMGRDKV